MSVLLVCDAPLETCFKSIPAIVVDGKPAAPPPWKITLTHDKRLLVTCSDACMRRALDRLEKRKVGSRRK